MAVIPFTATGIGQDIWQSVFGFLGLRETMRSCTRVCKEWREYAENAENTYREGNDVKFSAVPLTSSVIRYARSHGFPFYELPDFYRAISAFVRKIPRLPLVPLKRGAQLDLFFPAEKGHITLVYLPKSEPVEKKKLVFQDCSITQTTDTLDINSFITQSVGPFAVAAMFPQRADGSHLKICRVFFDIIKALQQLPEAPKKRKRPTTIYHIEHPSRSSKRKVETTAFSVAHAWLIAVNTLTTWLNNALESTKARFNDRY